MAIQTPLKFLAAAVGALVLLGATGCQQPSPTPTSSPASTSASPTPDAAQPTPASSKAPARNLPVPELPAAAKAETKEGLRAFADYWFEAYNYGLHTGDFTKFWAVTNPDCGTCKNITAGIPERYKAGGWVAGGDSAIGAYSDTFLSDVNDTYGPLMKPVEKPGGAYNSAGVLEEPFSGTPSEDFLVMYTRFKDGAWRVIDFGKRGSN